ncbi:MAG: class II aldolase/adducin family protein [Anaerolineae bacterium]|nr:class II aldolase/adducin family protein [Anaerolineae bacterium]
MAERLKEILNILRRQEYITVAELSERLGVAEATLHNDLNQLAEAGQVLRTHDGAQIADKRLRQEHPDEQLLAALVNLSRELGREERQFAILGEGNTSAMGSDGTFWVKASGSQLGNITAKDFCRVSLSAVENMLASEQLTDAEINAGLRATLVDSRQPQPSVETFLHALCLTEGEAAWVGHTHIVSVNQILCSHQGADPFLRPLFPDGIVVCGPAPAVVPYVDPGLPLALAVRQALREYKSRYQRPPKLLLMINHGPVALGQTADEVLNIMLMADKWAKILQGTYALGGPNFLTPEDVERIDSRMDEHYRRRRLVGQA